MDIVRSWKERFTGVNFFLERCRSIDVQNMGAIVCLCVLAHLLLPLAIHSTIITVIAISRPVACHANWAWLGQTVA